MRDVIVERETLETTAREMAEAIEKLLDYQRRNGAGNFQYEKYLDHVHNLTVALYNYRGK